MKKEKDTTKEKSDTDTEKTLLGWTVSLEDIHKVRAVIASIANEYNRDTVGKVINECLKPRF